MCVRLVAVLLSITSFSALADTVVFSMAANPDAPIRDVPSNAVVVDYAVIPNIRGLAENLVREEPQAFSFELPNLCRPSSWNSSASIWSRGSTSTSAGTCVYRR